MDSDCARCAVIRQAGPVFFSLLSLSCRHLSTIVVLDSEPHKMACEWCNAGRPRHFNSTTNHPTFIRAPFVLIKSYVARNQSICFDWCI